MSKYVEIQYIGRREPYTDNTCGSGAVFVRRGDVQLVQAEHASQMLRHPSVYRLADDKPVSKGKAKSAEQMAAERAQAERVAKDEADAKAKAEATQKDQDVRTSILMMDKSALGDFAQTNFSQRIDSRLGVDVLRQQVTAMFDRFGVNP
jgi:hypothetical protein